MDISPIDNIKSNYILKNIINYIQNNNFLHKIFVYSKKYQKKLDLQYIEPKEKYLKNIEFDITKYLSNSLEKDLLSKEYKDFFKDKNIDKDKIERVIYDIFEYKKIKGMEEEDINEIKDYEISISIYSPLFKLLSKTKNFEKKFTIYIPQKHIHEYKNDYINVFNDLNIKYSSIFYELDDIRQLNYIQKINIDFKKIKRLTIKVKEPKNETDKNMIEIYNKAFFETLLSLDNIANNLIYLNINYIKNYKINDAFFQNINSFKSLRYLYMNGFNFEKEFIFKLNTLKIISIKNCKNITSSEINYEQLKILELNNTLISGINELQRGNFKELQKLNLEYFKISEIGILKNESFKNLQELNLNGNKISDINELSKVNFKKLKILKLGTNAISNIQALENVDFEQLKILDLKCNKIVDISVLEIVNFRELEELDLSGNKISNINSLKNANFKELKRLNLHNNKLSDIKILAKVNFKELRELILGANELEDIDALEQVDFKHLKMLDLSSTEIYDINILKNVNFKELEILNLGFNRINDIKVLKGVNFKNLKTLDLIHNDISDINVLKKVDFKHLQKLDLNNNQISCINVLKEVNFEKLQILNLSHNKIYDFSVLENTNFTELRELSITGQKTHIQEYYEGPKKYKKCYLF